MFRIASAWLLACATVASADPVPLETVRSSIEGQEIFARGYLGRFDGGEPLFRSEDGIGYNVDFALSREELAKLDGCEIRGRVGSRLCKFSILAEVRLDGTRIELLVYEIQDFVEEVQ